ncbi:Ohr family peroxiredoxin [Aquipuribacter hungaricus]|uniref:Organic hydroperoxide resistance protein n=1 Tax=Aquipuribacter hungaricus TaxID=545624 RepID=A0ABV7WG67_9MICO
MTDTLYTAAAVSTGGGRDGRVRTEDGVLDLDLRMPTELGGAGGGANPESLFAAGYAACFHSALQGSARAAKVSVTGSSVTAAVSLQRDGEQGFRLAVRLDVAVPGVPREQAQELVDAAHAACPYSKATRGGIDVEVTLVQD